MSGAVREVMAAGDRVAADFLGLPARLYEPSGRFHDTAGERALLAGRHPLSGYFRVRAFVGYAGGEPMARAMLTRYPGDPTLYLGFFECVDDIPASAAIFEQAARVGRRDGFETVLGPVDASFWLRYRLKVDGFDNPPHFSEPLNKPYYQHLFAAAGYRVCDRYVSNFYPRVPAGHEFPRFDTRLRDFTGRGFVIRGLRPGEWGRAMRAVHRLLHQLYRDFPVFKPLRYEDFARVYRGFRLIADRSMIIMAYHRGTAVGFLIAVPDYGAGLAIGSPVSRLLSLARGHHHSERYALLYLGAAAEYPGLGSAMTGAFIDRIKRRGAGAVGALIHEGKVTEGYARELVCARNRYVLLRKELREAPRGR